jgi:biotin transport system substrate-specific component
MSIAIPARRPVLADLLPAHRLRDATLVVAGAATVALVGQVAVPLPFTPVPITLGTLAVLTVGGALGTARATLSLSLYVLVGVLGGPVFAGATGGWAAPSFGYVLGYIPAAACAGWLSRRGADRSYWRSAGSSAAATLLVYAAGVPWLAAAVGVGIPEALVMGVLPFVAGDLVKAALAALTLPTVWRLCGERPGQW